MEKQGHLLCLEPEGENEKYLFVLLIIFAKVQIWKAGFGCSIIQDFVYRIYNYIGIKKGPLSFVTSLLFYLLFHIFIGQAIEYDHEPV